MYKLIGADGKEYGPVPAEAVREWIRERRANGQTRARRENATDWTTLGALPEFAADLGTRPAPPPLPGFPATPQPATIAGKPAPKTSGLAIASLILGALGFCGVTAILGIVFGIVARVQIRRSQGRLAGRGLALTGIILSVVMLFVMFVAAGLILPALAKMKQQGRFQRQPSMEIQTDNNSDCGKNLRQVSLALRLYADQHDGKCPPAATWCDDVTPFLSRPDVLKCPRRSGDRSGFALNGSIAGRTMSAIPPDTILLFESARGWNAAGDASLLPGSASHGGKFTFGFADGSIREVTKEELQDLRWEP